MASVGEQDPFALERFVRAQDEGDTYERALAELRDGRKRSHWMWFVFPQLAGLGHSQMARRYAIGSVEEARAYRAHPVLGPRLLACASVLAGLGETSAREIFGEVDALKLRSSMTLFALATQPDSVFQLVLEKLFDGVTDPASERILSYARSIDHGP